MLSEIPIYIIEISKSIPWLFFFKKTEKIRYTLTYRIDEDRFWYYKEEKTSTIFGTKSKIVDDHLMKQNLEDSVTTLKKIVNRYDYLDISRNNDIKTYYLFNRDYIMYERIQEYSDKKELTYLKGRKNSFHTSSNKNIFLADENEIVDDITADDLDIYS